MVFQGEEGGPNDQKDGIDVKSRDIGSSISTPSKRRSKKKSEAAAASAQTSSSSEETQVSTSHGMMNYKFILGVALLSVIVGIILGKRY